MTNEQAINFAKSLGYQVEHNPKPIPDRGSDWDWVHVDFDGGPNETGGPPLDPRCGTAGSPVEALSQIRDLEADLAEQEALETIGCHCGGSGECSACRNRERLLKAEYDRQKLEHDRNNDLNAM